MVHSGGWRKGDRAKVISNSVPGYGRVGSVTKIEAGTVWLGLGDNEEPRPYFKSHLRWIRRA